MFLLPLIVFFVTAAYSTSRISAPEFQAENLAQAKERRKLNGRVIKQVDVMSRMSVVFNCGNTIQFSYGLQNASSQVKHRASEVLGSDYSSKTFSTELFCRRLWWFHFVLPSDLYLARKPRPRSSSARPAIPFVNQERLVLKFPIRELKERWRRRQREHKKLLGLD